MICFKNSRLIMENEIADGLSVLCDGEKITSIAPDVKIPADCNVIDCSGKYLSPGFIDIHVHGGGGFGAVTDNPEDIYKMCRAHNMKGTTALLPTTLAAPADMLVKSVKSIDAAKKKYKDAGILGAHLEGPFLSPLQCGAQNTSCLLNPTEENLELFDEVLGGVKMMGAAPELEGGFEFGKLLRERGISATIAHSNATFEQIEQAISCGYSDVTHIYSGCSTVTRENGYRISGVVEAGLYFDSLTVGVIADLKHLPVSLLKLIYKCKSAERIALMTDALEFAACELTEGTSYTQKNGVETVYEDGVMKLPSHKAFAGSVATMNVLVRNMYKYVGVPLCDAVRMATRTPADIIGEKHKGRLEIGADSDLILFDDDVNVSFCMIGDSIINNEITV